MGGTAKITPPDHPVSFMRFFNSAGVNIAYVDVAPDEGAGDPILLIHGFASNHAVNWVNTLWVKSLTKAGYRAIALDNRGHGQSEKLYRPEDYDSFLMAEDSRRLLDHLGIERADVMGYSMGARIAAHMALADPERMRSLLIGGSGVHLVEGVGLPLGIADAMEARSLDDLTDPMQRMFRAFAEQTKSDLKALAACIRGSRQTMTPGGGGLDQAADPDLGRHQRPDRGLGAGACPADAERQGARHPGPGPQSGGRRSDAQTRRSRISGTTSVAFGTGGKSVIAEGLWAVQLAFRFT